MLLPYVYKPSVRKVQGRIGVIPHFIDLTNTNLRRLVESGSGTIIVIDIQHYKDWHFIIDQILSCEFILSSSLHGLILSDAYNVPNQWVVFSNLILGGRFKYEDYYSSVGKESREVIVKQNTSIEDLLENKRKYQSIKFDPRPLLKACPFEIVHPTLLSLLNV